MTESTCKKCNTSKTMSRLYQCSYCAFKYHNDPDCTLWRKFPLKSTEGTLEGVPLISGTGHAKGNINENTDVCNNCYIFLTAAKNFINKVKRVLPQYKKDILNGTFQVINQSNQRLVTSPEHILNTYNTIEVGDIVNILTKRQSQEDTQQPLKVLRLEHNNVEVECQRSVIGGKETYPVIYKKTEVRIHKKH